MLLHTWRVDNLGIQVHECFAVGKEEWRVRVYLAPDEHVLGGERDQFVALSHIGTHRVHDLRFGQVNLRVQVGYAELAPATTPGSQLHHAESGSLIGEKDGIARGGVSQVDFSWQR